MQWTATSIKLYSILRKKKKLQPDLVYTHSGADLNIDHRIVSNAVLTAFRPEPNENVKKLGCLKLHLQPIIAIHL